MIKNNQAGYEQHLSCARSESAKGNLQRAAELYAKVSPSEYIESMSVADEAIFEAFATFRKAGALAIADPYFQFLDSKQFGSNNSCVLAKYLITKAEYQFSTYNHERALQLYCKASNRFIQVFEGLGWELRQLYGEMRCLLLIGSPNKIFCTAMKYERALSELPENERDRWNSWYQPVKGHAFLLLNDYAEAYRVFHNCREEFLRLDYKNQLMRLEADVNCILVEKYASLNSLDLESVGLDKNDVAEQCNSVASNFSRMNAQDKMLVFSVLHDYAVYLQLDSDWDKVTPLARDLLSYLCSQNNSSGFLATEMRIMLAQASHAIDESSKSCDLLSRIESDCMAYVERSELTCTKTLKLGRFMFDLAKLYNMQSNGDRARACIRHACEILSHYETSDYDDVCDFVAHLD